MANSTIIEKYGTCIDCVAQGDMSFKPIVADRCKAFHYNKYRREISSKKQQARQQAMRVKYLPANKEQLIKKDKIKDNELELWFLLQMNSSEMICDNCGKSLAHFSNWAWKSSQHHVLDKAHFPTVKYNPSNHLVLCVYECHSLWHSSMLAASKMPVFNKAKKIVELLYPLLNDAEKGRVSPYYNLDTNATQVPNSENTKKNNQHNND